MSREERKRSIPTRGMRPSPEEAHGWLDKLALSQEAQRRILWGAIAAAGAALTIKWLGGRQVYLFWF